MFVYYSILFLFLYISKEFLAYGEERLIVCGYLFLLLLGVFLLSNGLGSFFQERVDTIKVEFNIFFSNILDILIQTQLLIKKYFLINVLCLKLYVSIFNEFCFFFLSISSFGLLKTMFFNLKMNNVLFLSLSFVQNFTNIIYSSFFPLYLLRNVIWFFSSLCTWSRVDVSVVDDVIDEGTKKLVIDNNQWFISLVSFLSVKKNFGYRFVFYTNKLIELTQ